MVGDFACFVESGRPVGVVQVHGELTLATAPRLRTAVHKCLAEQPDAVVIDLSGMTAAQDTVLTLFPALARTAIVFAGASVLLTTPSGSLRERLAEAAVTRLLPVYPSMAESLAQAHHVRSPGRVRQRLACDLTAAETARQLTCHACRQWGLDGLADRAAVIVTELVANAVLHARTDLVLSVATLGPHLYIGVYDACGSPARLGGTPGCDGEPGRGLLVVEAMAAEWGNVPTAGGKVVWAALAIGAQTPLETW